MRFLKYALKKLYFFLNKLFKKFLRLSPSIISDAFISKKIQVFHKKKKVFKIEDKGWITRYRAKSFSEKEPETLSWIDTFDKEDILLDVGANIGIYSLYGAAKGLKVISIEPESRNFSLLNRNITINFFNDFIKPFPIALNDKFLISYLHLSNENYGGALHSFDRKRDHFGEKMDPKRSQGIIGMTMDNFLDEINEEINHIKIDVDGNEDLVLMGSSKTLRKNSTKSILIELAPVLPNYKEIIRLIESSGFYLEFPDINYLNMEIKTNPKKTINHIFKKY